MTKRNRVDFINFIRVVATIMVFMLHTTIMQGKTWPAGEIWKSGSWTFIFMTPAWAGVWILFIISGYLAGKGFASGRYKLQINDIMKYYLKKIKKVWIPTIAFIFICCIFVFPSFVIDNPTVIWKFITCLYRGAPGVVGVGATWFVFTLMYLYLVTPIICLLIDKLKISRHKRIIWLLLGTVIIVGACFRQYAFVNKWDWYMKVYSSSIGSLDLYISGILLSYITFDRVEDRINKKLHLILKISSCIAIVTLILYNSWIYFHNDMVIYQYRLPSVYIVMICVYLFAFDYKHNVKNEALSMTSIKKNPFRLIDWFSGISFEFYLFHSLVLNQISPLVGASSPLKQHIKLLVLTAAITIIISIGFSRIFSSRKVNV